MGVRGMMRMDVTRVWQCRRRPEIRRDLNPWDRRTPDQTNELSLDNVQFRYISKKSVSIFWHNWWENKELSQENPVQMALVMFEKKLLCSIVLPEFCDCNFHNAWYRFQLHIKSFIKWSSNKNTWNHHPCPARWQAGFLMTFPSSQVLSFCSAS